MTKKTKIVLQYALSFFLPAMIMALAFFTLGIFPGGKNMVLTYDLKALYMPLYGYISDSGTGFNNLFHSMSGGLGGNNYATIVLCISPFDIIYSVIPLSFLPSALYFMILFKIGLCGLGMCIYIKNNNRFKVSGIMTVLLSCCYGLMSYNIMYFIAPMWYDCVFLLPLLALALEKLIAGKKSPSFVILMTICMIDNYYIAYMVVIALIVYFVFRSVEEWMGSKEFIRRTLMFAIHGVLSFGGSLFVIIPAILDFKRGKLAEDADTQSVAIKNTLLDVLYSFKNQRYAGLDFNASPNIYCGTIVVILALIWFFFGKRNIRARIAGLFVVAFYFASFIIGPLDRAWHGFRDPVCFSVRYAFTFSFFMILFAVRGLDLFCKKPSVISKSNKLLASIVIFIYTMFELFSNSGYILSRIGTDTGYTYSGEYYKYVDAYDNLIRSDNAFADGSYGRLVNTSRFSSYDGALFGYNGLSRFSSSYNYSLSELFRSLGFGTIYHSIGEKGMTPPSISLFDTGYVISFIADYSDYYELVGEYNGFKLFRNDLKLPFAYAICASGVREEFGNDPFANQNLVYQELFGGDHGRIEIFTEVECVPTDISVDMSEGILSSDSYVFTSEKSGHYYFYVEYRPEENIEERKPAEDGYNDRIIILRNYIFDDEIGEYGNGQYSYCVDLGFLNEGEKHRLTLQSSNTCIGEIGVYYYNEDVYAEVCSAVNGFDIRKISKDGIVLNGVVQKQTDILITLPYEDGYKVYVDGKETSYGSYRDCIMVVSVGQGEHEILIKYYPPGFFLGLCLSVVSLLVTIIFFLCRKRRK